MMYITALSYDVFFSLMWPTASWRNVVRNSVLGQAGLSKASETHPLSEEGKQVFLMVFEPAPVRAATQTAYRNM